MAYLLPVYTMDHEVGPSKMVFSVVRFHGLNFPWSDFLKKLIYKAFGPFTRCNPNMDQGEWPCNKKVNELVV